MAPHATSEEDAIPDVGDLKNHLPTTSNYWDNLLTGCSPSDFPERLSGCTPQASLSVEHVFSAQVLKSERFDAPTLVYAAWAILVAKYTASSDVVFGQYVNAQDKLIERPLRIRVDNECQVADLLKAVAGQLQDSKQNVGQWPKDGTLDDQVFALNSTVAVAESENCNAISPGPLAHGLHVIVSIDQSRVNVTAHYDEKLCSRTQVSRILKQLEHTSSVLITVEPSVPLENVDYLNDSESEDITRWNKSLPTKVDECMHDRILEVAKARLKEPAICAWDGDFTFEEFEKNASILAKHLKESFHLRPDEVVLLHFEKSKYAALSMYAVQKAGCAYGFLGLSDPMTRLISIVRNTRARVVLTSASLQQKLSLLPGEVVGVTPALFDTLPNVEMGYRAPVQPHNLAYVLFTSGSTGTPKAVGVEHSAGTTSAIEHGTVEEVTSDCRVIQFAAYTFDVSTSETLTTLIKGGCVCIPSEGQRLDDLAGAINHFNVNHAFLTPTVVSLLEPKDIPTVKTLKLGGEALTKENIAIWADKVRLSNSYGVCEAAIRSCFRQGITPETDFSNCGSAVGCALWVTDPSNPNILAPIGTIGELVIEGPCLARCYLGDAKKTAASFVKPSWLSKMFPERPCRVYRTGDLVRYADDGTIRFVGRDDSQVKIHGQRVELREIEHHMMVFAKKQLAATVLSTKGRYADKLVGLLAFGDGLVQDGVLKVLEEQARPEQTTIFRDLEMELAKAVPSYMVPRTWLAVEGLPINQSGKMDRRLLKQWVEAM